VLREKEGEKGGEREIVCVCVCVVNKVFLRLLCLLLKGNGWHCVFVKATRTRTRTRDERRGQERPGGEGHEGSFENLLLC